MESRQQLRSEIRQRRNSLTLAQQKVASIQLLLQVNKLFDEMHNAPHRVALYLTNDGEIDTGPLIEQLKEREFDLLLPVLHPFTKGYLNFQSVNRHTQWHNNKYGIQEPKPDASSVGPISTIDVIFMPLVAFDAQGNRLGMGGGYYDRTLAQLQPISDKAVRPLLVGLAHDCQEVKKLPTEAWDVPIDVIITPTRIIKYNQ